MLHAKPGAVIGAGRVGRAISNMAQPPCPLYGRNMLLPRDPKGPIWVCTTNDGLDDVLQRLDPPQRNQLIFIQNGMLLPFLEAHQLQRNTQVLLYMSATEDGAVTDGGRTAVHGPMSQHVQQLLQQGGVSCKVLDSWEEYSSAMVVKLLWSSIFWLLSAALGGIPVGQVVENYSPAVRHLVNELLPIAHDYLNSKNSSSSSKHRPTQLSQQVHGVQHKACEQAVSKIITAADQKQLQGAGPPSSNQGRALLQDPAAVVHELNSYSMAIATAVPSAEMARKEFAWRNGWFISRQPTQQHVHWLQQAGCNDLLQEYGIVGPGY